MRLRMCNCLASQVAVLPGAEDSMYDHVPDAARRRVMKDPT
jgi:hypothetical protein